MWSDGNDRQDRHAAALDSIGAVVEEYTVGSWRLVLDVRFEDFFALWSVERPEIWVFREA